MNRDLTRDEWYQLDDQMSRTPAKPDAEGVSGEHLKLIAILNRFGFNPLSKQEAMQLAEELLNARWEDGSQ